MYNSGPQIKLKYGWIGGLMALGDAKLLQECSELFSNHYGLWSGKSKYPGQKIRLSPNRIADWLQCKDSSVHWARFGNMLIGYAVAIKTKIPYYGIISWVTQLVVHEQYRNRDVAKTLLFSIWGLSSHFAWGVVSSNPYGVRALEKATRRRSVPDRISRHKAMLLKVGKNNVPYISDDTELIITTKVSKINTRFYVDHSEVGPMVESVTSEGTPWLLGPLDEGWEWFAFTFHDQQQISLTSQEIRQMLEASDQVTKQAYSRMQLGTRQRWAQHAAKEARQIVEFCGLVDRQSILDLGCGVGRHAIALAELGFKVTGIDYVEDFIDRAREKSKRLGLDHAHFQTGDVRYVDLGRRYDAIICLYDVVGTYTEDSENMNILRTVANHLELGGRALISVMNYELTERQARHTFSLTDL